jgi:hypothetical protein
MQLTSSCARSPVFTRRRLETDGLAAVGQGPRPCFGVCDFLRAWEQGTPMSKPREWGVESRHELLDSLPAIGRFGGGEKTIGCEGSSGETDAVG